VWNEEGAVARTIEEVERDVLAHFEDGELIVVDDASSDGTPRILAGLARELPRLHVERAEHNRGHGPSVLRGLARAEGEWIFQLDSDAQFVPAEFWELWPRRCEADLVLGVRSRRRDPLHRVVLSRIVSPVVSLLAGRRLRDPNTPFRLIRRRLWEDLRPLLGDDVLAPSILVSTGAAARGWRVVEVQVTHLPRARGRSSLRAWRLVRFSLWGLWQLARFRYALTRAPARDTQ